MDLRSVQRGHVKHSCTPALPDRLQHVTDEQQTTEISPMFVQCQAGLERLDGGASAYIYAVNDQVVLKSPVTFVLLRAASSLDQYEYALETVCHYEDIQNERAILRQLERLPHPNIIQPITLEHPEGLYLRRYLPLSRRLKTEKLP